jgi:hypothetical protein
MLTGFFKPSIRIDDVKQIPVPNFEHKRAGGPVVTHEKKPDGSFDVKIDINGLSGRKERRFPFGGPRPINITTGNPCRPVQPVGIPRNPVMPNVPDIGRPRFPVQPVGIPRNPVMPNGPLPNVPVFGRPRIPGQPIIPIGTRNPAMPFGPLPNVPDFGRGIYGL